MVHLLEDRLGVALFERKANKLVTTAAGRAYQSGLTPIFDALASLTAQVTAPSSVRVLTIGVGPTFLSTTSPSTSRSSRPPMASPARATCVRSALYPSQSTSTPPGRTRGRPSSTATGGFASAFASATP